FTKKPMSKTNLAIVGLILISVSLSCRSFMPRNESAKNAEPGVDFTNAGKGLDVRVQVDKKRTSSGKVTKAGGSVSLAAETAANSRSMFRRTQLMQKQR